MGGRLYVLKRILYRVLRKLVGISFNVLNLCLAGNLPPFGCISVVVEDQGRFLLLRRPEGCFVFPGGFVRWREHPRRTAQREFKEETGLQVELHHVIGCYSTSSRSLDSLSTLTIAYCGEISGGEMRGSIEGRPCWIEGSELPGALDCRYTEILNDYREHRKQHVGLS